MLKKLIRKWLGLESLEDRFARSLSDVKLLERETQELYSRTSHNSVNIREIHEAINIGVDVSPYNNSYYEGSWAVVVIKGKQPIVKFLDLRGYHVSEIEEIIKRFERTSKTIDSPFNMFR